MENKKKVKEQPFKVPLTHNEISMLMEGKKLTMEIKDHTLNIKQRVVVSLDKYGTFEE